MNDVILVVGAGGLAGHEVFWEARRRHGDRVHGTYRTPRLDPKRTPNLHSLDLLDFRAVQDFILTLKPRYVINCAGIVKRICHDPYEAITVNSAFPHFLKKLLSGWGGRLLQLSTDGVFSGKKGNYSEVDPPDPQDLYGRTKLMGEVCDPPHLTIRTSFIGYELGTERGFLSWFLAQKGTVQGYRRVIWSGLTHRFLAQMVNDLLFREDMTGLLHVSGESISKHDLLLLAAEAFDKRDVEIKPVDTPAANYSLNGSKLRRYGFSVPSIREMLLELRNKSNETQTPDLLPYN